MCHMSSVTCQVLCVRFQVAGVRCQVSGVRCQESYYFFGGAGVVELVGGGMLSTGPAPSSFVFN